MRQKVVVFCLLPVLLFSSCVSGIPEKKVDDMKIHIVELNEFVEDNANLLETLLQVQSQYFGYRFFIQEGNVKVIKIDENANNVISERTIDNCEFFDNSVKEIIHQLTNELPDYGSINISPDEVMILMRQNDNKDVGIYLSTLSADFSGKRDAYCEQIVENWYAIIIYFPLA